MPNGYLRLLHSIDTWTRAAQRAHPDKVPCTKGCRECCLGLFDISIADRTLLRDGLAQTDEPTRRDIRTRSREIMVRLRAAFPRVRRTLEGLEEDEIDRLCDHLGPVECPVLGPQGECRLYEHRPLVCRLAGVPVVDLSGETLAAEGCSRCTLSAADAPRLDWHDLRRRERALLRRIDADRPDVPLLIPQALESPP